jgi:hypothetical protein
MTAVRAGSLARAGPAQARPKSDAGPALAPWLRLGAGAGQPQPPVLDGAAHRAGPGPFASDEAWRGV